MTVIVVPRDANSNYGPQAIASFALSTTPALYTVDISTLNQSPGFTGRVMISGYSTTGGSILVEAPTLH